MASRSDDLRSLWLTALAEPVGLLVQTNDFTRLRQALYAERRAMSHDLLADLQIRASPFDDGNLVICHPPRELP